MLAILARSRKREPPRPDVRSWFAHTRTDILTPMDPAVAIRDARWQAGLSQAALAQRAGTSQAAVSAYESGRKQPSVATLGRLLTAAGRRLAVEPAPAAVRQPTPAQLARSGCELAAVLELAEALPVRHARRLRYPPLGLSARRAA